MRWEKVNPYGVGPGKRWGHTCNAVDGGKFLYLFGGYGHTQTNQVHVFDTVKQTWSLLGTKGFSPVPRDSHSSTAVGDRLFVFGGTDGTNQLNDLHMLDIPSHTWTCPTVRGEGPSAREGHSAAVVGKRIFVFGGSGKSADNVTDIFLNDLYILDTETLDWTCATTSGNPPSPRDSHTCSSWKNKIIVIGGEDENDCYLSDVHILDTDTLVWRELSTSGQLLPPRAGHSTVSFGKNFFVFGGFTDAQTLYNDLHMLDIDTGVWTKVTTTPYTPSARFALAGECLDPIMGGVLVFIGGCNKYLDSVDDMYYLHTGFARESVQRPEKLSLRKQLKMKCHGPPMNPVENQALYGYGVGAGIFPPMILPNYSQPRRLINVPVNPFLPPEKKPFVAKVTESVSEGYTIETVVDGKPLRGFLFLNKPETSNPATNTTSSRKRTVGGTSSDVSNGSDPNNFTRSKLLKPNGVEDGQEVRGDGSEAHEHCKEATSAVISSIPITAGASETFMKVRGDGSEPHEQCKEAVSAVISSIPITAGTSETFTEVRGDSSEPHEHCKEAASAVISSTPITTGVLETFKASVNPEPESVSLNQKNEEKIVSPKSLGEILKNDGANDMTSSKSEVQTDQTNLSVFKYENLTMTRHDQTNDAPISNIDVLKPAAAENAVLQSNQGTSTTGDCSTPTTEDTVIQKN